MTGEADGEGVARLDTTVPHSARIWNYWLGGEDNYAVDREAGDQYLEIFPGVIRSGPMRPGTAIHITPPRGTFGPALGDGGRGKSGL